MVVARAAKKENRVLLTANYDMVLFAIDEGTRFIWFDQRGRSPTRLEMAHIALNKWDEWEELLSDPSVNCLKVGRSAVEVLSIKAARARAERRFKASQKTKVRVRAHVKKDEQQSVLSFETDD